MDTEARLSQLLASPPVVPDYAAKLSQLGSKMRNVKMPHDVFTQVKNTISMVIGHPNAAMSPVAGIDIRLSDGQTIRMEEQHAANLRLYNLSDGVMELKQWLWDFHKEEHKPPQMCMDDHPSKFDLAVTCGINHALQSSAKVILDMDGSDTVLLEDVTYVSVVGNLKVHGVNLQGVDIDDEGIIPEALEDVLSSWNERHPGKKLPKVLYAITSAHNPTGYKWSLHRMIEIYLICRKYDLLIFEDGAYYFVQFGERDQTFQSLDIDGRVLRFDTFSKSIGAGYRVGWISGPNVFITKVVLNYELTCVHASTVAQCIIYALLKNWGPEGFRQHSRKVATFYQRRAECLMNSFEKYLTGLASWTVPKGGMFSWLSIKGITDSSEVVKNLAKEGIIVAPGNVFHVDSRPNNCMRVCYALVPEEEMDTAIKCLGEILQRTTVDH